MPTLVLWVIGAAAVAGLAVKLYLEWTGARDRITDREFAVGLTIISLFAAPISAYIGWKIVQADNLRFNEVWHGWETQAVKQELACTRDGPCEWTYHCDSYKCNPHSCHCIKVGKGSVCSTCWDTCYHHCPYVTNEYNFTVNTTVGDFPIAAHMFPMNPDSYRWKANVDVPSDVIQRAGVGEPPAWRQVADRLAHDTPGPASACHQYDNFLLASEWTIISESTTDVEAHRKRNILPDLPRGIVGRYGVNRVLFVGSPPVNRQAWERGVSYLNAQLGSELQGDLFVVVIKHEQTAIDPDSYEFALHAHWLDTERFGRDTLAKNAIVLILGTIDGVRVAWVRAFTGMPKGNEAMLAALESKLTDVAMDRPEDIVGAGQSHHVRGVIRRPETVTPSIVERVLWGLDDPATKFQRARMDSYLYLKNEIRVKPKQQIVIAVVAFGLCLVVWLVLVATEHSKLQ